MSRPKKGGQGVRRLVTISQKNAAFLQWWGEQESPSTSLALVLADWIERHGFVDVVNRPVRQLPPGQRRARPAQNRGRPPAGSRDFLDEDAAGDLDEPREPREPVGPAEQNGFASHERPEQPEQVIPGDHGMPASLASDQDAPDQRVRERGAPKPGPGGSDRADEPEARTPEALPVAAALGTPARSNPRSASRAEAAVSTDDADPSEHRRVNSENYAGRVLSDGTPEQFDMNSIFGH